MRQSLVLLPLVCLLPLLPASCAPGEADWKPPSIVTAEGAKAWYSLSPQYGLLFGPAKPDGPVALLLRDGDIVEGQDHQPVPYRAADGAAIAVTSEGGRTMLAGKTVAVSLGGDEAWPWLEKAAPQDLAALRALDLAEALTPERLALVKKVAEQNPTVGLHAGSRDAFRQVVPLFQPAWLSLSTETFEEQDFAILAACKGLRSSATRTLSAP